MSEAAAEIFRRGAKISPTGEQDVREGAASKISNSGFVPFSSKFTNNSAEKNSSPQFANTTSKTTSSSLTINCSDRSILPTSFERWCVDSYAKFYTRICVYYLFLLIADYIVTFIQISKALFPWTVLRSSMSAVGNLFTVGVQSTAPFPRRRQNLQQPSRNVLRSPCTDSPSLRCEKLSTYSREGRAISQTLDQRRSSVVSQQKLMGLKKINVETRTKGTGFKEPVPMVCDRRSTSVFKDSMFRRAELFQRLRHNMQQTVGSVLSSPSVNSLSLMSKHLSVFTRNSRSTSQTFEQQRFSAVQRLEIMNLRSSNSETRAMETGSLSHGPIVRARLSTTIVEDFLSVGIRPAATFPRRRHNIQQLDGRKGEQATPKHGSTKREKTSSSKQCRNMDPRWKEKHPRASNTKTRSLDGRKGFVEQTTAKNGPKTGEKASSSKQRRNTDPRREGRRPRSSNTETRIHDGRKGVFEQTTQKQGSTTGKKPVDRNRDRGNRA